MTLWQYQKKPEPFYTKRLWLRALFENQLGVFRACNDLAVLWGLPHSLGSPPRTSGCVSMPTSDPSAPVTPEISPSLFSPFREEKLALNFGSLPTASQLMQNLSATDFRTSFGSDLRPPTTTLENMQETTAENENRRTEAGSSLVATKTTTDISKTTKATLTPRKRRSIGPCKNYLIRNSERKLELSVWWCEKLLHRVIKNFVL